MLARPRRPEASPLAASSTDLAIRGDLCFGGCYTQQGSGLTLALCSEITPWGAPWGAGSRTLVGCVQTRTRPPVLAGFLAPPLPLPPVLRAARRQVLCSSRALIEMASAGHRARGQFCHPPVPGAGGRERNPATLGVGCSVPEMLGGEKEPAPLAWSCVQGAAQGQAGQRLELTPDPRCLQPTGTCCRPATVSCCMDTRWPRSLCWRRAGRDVREAGSSPRQGPAQLHLFVLD